MTNKQHRITEPGPLHAADGSLREPGWATKLLLEYDRARIKASKFLIKEWDYYAILTDEYGIAITVADNAYLGFVAVTVFDFVNPEETTESVMTILPLGSFKMPPTSASGDVHFKQKGFNIQMHREAQERIIMVDVPDFAGGKGLFGSVHLSQPDDMDSMVIATPFKKKAQAFYYNQKVNCMPASGSIQFGNRELMFDPQHAHAVLDWGRGVWTYANTWYWGSASGVLNGESFGFNIGYGFGDTSAATENMLFYQGKAHKLDQVTFNIPEPEFLKPWTFTSNDGRFEMDFVPILDRFSDTNVLLIRSWQHQVFGRFTGTCTLDDGTVLEVKDFLGFAEKVANRW
ncbi:MAG: DUF2804 domain-containing protein [Candidatus Marinimicrobia bacterium]|nr:DUF2804 domain-containing protein [Candidatus Neomarinimicrobiota bacterium]MCF7903938.1 DUF2804 domain-containing protein [Candidatus Neomarinimicrobiota bacterium]